MGLCQMKPAWGHLSLSQRALILASSPSSLFPVSPPLILSPLCTTGRMPPFCVSWDSLVVTSVTCLTTLCDSFCETMRDGNTVRSDRACRGGNLLLAEVAIVTQTVYIPHMLMSFKKMMELRGACVTGMNQHKQCLHKHREWLRLLWHVPLVCAHCVCINGTNGEWMNCSLD